MKKLNIGGGCDLNGWLFDHFNPRTVLLLWLSDDFNIQRILNFHVGSSRISTY